MISRTPMTWIANSSFPRPKVKYLPVRWSGFWEVGMLCVMVAMVSFRKSPRSNPRVLDIQHVRDRESRPNLFVDIWIGCNTHLHVHLVAIPLEGHHGPLLVLRAAGLEVAAVNHGGSAEPHGPQTVLERGLHIADNHVGNLSHGVEHVLAYRRILRHQHLTGNPAGELSGA